MIGLLKKMLSAFSFQLSASRALPSLRLSATSALKFLLSALGELRGSKSAPPISHFAFRISHSHPVPTTARRAITRPGLSLVEMLLALAICALLLTATTAALNASFYAYASAAQQASAQTSTRMVINRLLQLIRTSTAHGPLLADGSTTPPVTLAGNVITSHFIELIDPNGMWVKVEYRSATKELWVVYQAAGSALVQEQPVIGGVTAATFQCVRRQNDQGLWVLERGTMDLTVEPGADTSLALEIGPTAPVRMIASTMPRKLE